MSTRHAPDYRFLSALGVLLLFGLIMLSSASSAIAYATYQDTYHFVKRQILFGLIPGIVFGYLVYRRDYRTIERLVLPLFTLSVFLLALVFVPAQMSDRKNMQQSITSRYK